MCVYGLVQNERMKFVFLLKQFRQVTRANKPRTLKIVNLALIQTSMSIEEREKYNTKVNFAIRKTENNIYLLCL